MSTANDANTIGARKDVVKEGQGSFSNPAMIANYADETPRKVPGLADLHRMAMLLSQRAGTASGPYSRGRCGRGHGAEGDG